MSTLEHSATFCIFQYYFMNFIEWRPGWPDAQYASPTNFRPMGDCILWVVFWQLYYLPKILGYFFPKYKLCVDLDNKNLQHYVCNLNFDILPLDMSDLCPSGTRASSARPSPSRSCRSCRGTSSPPTLSVHCRSGFHESQFRPESFQKKLSKTFSPEINRCKCICQLLYLYVVKILAINGINRHSEALLTNSFNKNICQKSTCANVSDNYCA
jgi:hypothetical protein